MLTAEEILKLLDVPGTWQVGPKNDFPDKMRAILGRLGDNVWLVVEHDAFDGQELPPGEFGYDGTLVVPPAHVYHLTYDVAKAAYQKGKAFLDAQAKTKE
jgi:hypothetical protein